jgi:hypothetical protein
MKIGSVIMKLTQSTVGKSENAERKIKKSSREEKRRNERAR